MKRHRKLWIWLAAAVALVVAAIAGERIYYRQRYVPGPRPACHAFLMRDFGIFCDTARTSIYPNVDGDADASLAHLRAILPDESIYDQDHFQDYRYVPGLTKDDPDDLVLFYKTTKTRFPAHHHSPSLWLLPFIKARWAVIGPRFQGPLHGGSYWLDTPEFVRRLQKTLDFLKANERPHWEEIVREHGEFLNSIRD